MAITFPRTDIMSAVQYTDIDFEPVQRQELSTQSNGAIRGKDFGSAIWMASFTTAPLHSDDMLAFKTMLLSLDGVLGTFEACDLRRPLPRAYAAGDAATGSLNTVNVNNKALSISGLGSGQIISAGDYVSFDYGTSRALHQAMETVTGSAEFEVRPHIRPGFSGGATVQIAAPRGLFTLMPKSIKATQGGNGEWVVTFQAVQYLT